MEKYIFSTTDNLTPKARFLKRNSRITFTPTLSPNIEKNFKEKTPSEFDYSYYSHLHSHASIVNVHKIGSLRTLFEEVETLPKRKIKKYVHSKDKYDYLIPLPSKLSKVKNNEEIFNPKSSSTNNDHHHIKVLHKRPPDEEACSLFRVTPRMSEKSNLNFIVSPKRGNMSLNRKAIKKEKNKGEIKYEKVKEEYAKFMNSKEMKHLWQKIMEKLCYLGTSTS